MSARPQRRRQDHDHVHHRRDPRRQVRLRGPGRRRPDPAAGRQGGVQRHRTGAGEPPGVPAHGCQGEPSRRRVRQTGSCGGGRGRHRGYLPALSSSGRTQGSARRHPVRRRAADAGYRQGADDPSQDLAHGRAVRRPGAPRRRGDLRHHPRVERRGGHDSSGRAERPHGARRGTQVLSHRKWRDHLLGVTRASSKRTRSFAGPTSGHRRCNHSPNRGGAL